MTQRLGDLYIVSTPIGNLDDITHRGVSVLQEVDAIISEDSRRSRKLLTYHGIETPLTTSYYQGAESRSTQFVDRLLDGEELALISDAGTPLISDPGFKLVTEARSAGIEVIPVPGPTALIAALVVSGQPTDSFVFEGMLPKGEGKKRSYLESIWDERRTVVVYESPHRLWETLEILSQVMPDRNLTLCRELTKIHEEKIQGTPKEISSSLKSREGNLKGELTLVIRGVSDAELQDRRRSRYSDLSYQEQYQALTKIRNLSRQEALKKMADLRGIPKREVYDRLEEEKSHPDK